MTLNSMRKTEGAALWQDIKARLNVIRTTAEEILPLVDQVMIAAKDRLEKRVHDLTGGLELDRERLTSRGGTFGRTRRCY